MRGSEIPKKYYDCSYEVNDGTIRQNITFKGNYSGKATAFYHIEQKDIEWKLDKTSYTYTGKAVCPKVTATVDGKKLNEKLYTVKYSKNKAIGTGYAYVELDKKASADLYGLATNPAKKLGFSIKDQKLSPRATLKSATLKSTALTLKMSCNESKPTYKIQYSTDKKFKKSVSTKTTTKSSYTLNLKKGKTYYVRINATVKSIGGKSYVSKWTSVKTVKVK